MPGDAKDRQAQERTNRRRPSRRRIGRRRAWIGAALVLVLAVGFDARRPPAAQLTTRAALLAISAYQATLSKLMPAAGVQCRFEPTCSHYAAGSIRRYGFWKGSGKAARRLLRCGPWTELGTVDPP